MILKYRKYLLLFALAIFFIPSLSKASSLSFISPGYPVAPEIATSSDIVNVAWQWQALSPVFDYKFISSQIYDPSRPMTIKISYDKTNNFLKKIFVYDELSRVWTPIETKDFPNEKYVSAVTTSIAGRLALFSDPEILSVGTASWYSYKGGNFAASPDFAKGSVIRVYNLKNNKFVDVVINDWGPERAKHPDRVIDLDKVAFKKIASTGDGLVKIKIEPLKVVSSALNIKMAQQKIEPIISASSAIILNEKNLQILWSKNSDKISPLASLTKLVAAKVFLDLKPSLNKIVTYKIQDEKYNNEYCKPGDSARLKLKDGETLTSENLLYAALVGSNNNAVESLVRASGLSRANFIAQMNKTAKDLGATSTKFIEPTGLSPKNVSSPYEYAILTKEILNNPLIQKISTTASYKFKTLNTKKEFRVTNTNKLVQASSYSIIGSKTGYLDEAGYCLMTRVKTAQGNLIVVNFSSKNREESFLDNETLIRYGSLQLKK
jgi:D-alanyl-D-alanine endopeptidase (penicillin-binding protein 7)